MGEGGESCCAIEGMVVQEGILKRGDVGLLSASLPTTTLCDIIYIVREETGSLNWLDLMSAGVLVYGSHGWVFDIRSVDSMGYDTCIRCV